ncbi:hypothetical protein Rh054_02950 [Rickettsia conorii subsp. heilongjiangensis 054]|uniref:hypothetical protein n=1 Tax=Rickettsia conorii TaxID=781 RepID=UPI000219E48C|nr:hypothetical protein [Rickettsia conorii]AEK74559.1 hypothetical protein Rh054_02950 [Rickettsia conorii subsp. heilongjiangensis 054]
MNFLVLQKVLLSNVLFAGDNLGIESSGIVSKEGEYLPVSFYSTDSFCLIKFDIFLNLFANSSDNISILLLLLAYKTRASFIFGEILS